MTKLANDEFYDAAFDWLANNTIRMAACSAAPADYAGIAAVTLAEVVMAPADFTNAVGDTSGRKVTVASKSAVPIDVSGTATHVVLHDNAAILGYITECDSLVLTAGPSNTVNFPAWDIEIADPV